MSANFCGVAKLVVKVKNTAGTVVASAKELLTMSRIPGIRKYIHTVHGDEYRSTSEN